jgi:hypothetical protein
VCNFELSQRRETIGSMDPKTFYNILYNEIFDNIVTNLETPFDSLKKLEFLSLIDPSKFTNYNKEF